MIQKKACAGEEELLTRSASKRGVEGSARPRGMADLVCLFVLLFSDGV
jgi:hypothetical protein